MMDIKSFDLPRILLAIFAICGLAGLSLWIVSPFLPALLWAAMIVVATWPLLLALQTRLYHRRALAVAVMVVALLLVFVVPFTLAIGTLVDNAGQIVDWGKALTELKFPDAPPAWLQQLPLLGDYLAEHWRLNETGLPQKLAPYVKNSVSWFLREVGNFGLLTMQFLLTVIIAGILYANGELAGNAILRFGRRLANHEGEKAILLAGQAIRGVALGVVVTALVQSALAGLGLLVVGIPFAAILTAVVFMLAIAQLGPVLVLGPAVAWLYWSGASGWGTALLVWTLLVGSLDNVLRPVLIRKGADLPLLLIFAGVVGGLIAFGLVGIFIGPVVLAVTYTLLLAWVNETQTNPT